MSGFAMPIPGAVDVLVRKQHVRRSRETAPRDSATAAEAWVDWYARAADSVGGSILKARCEEELDWLIGAAVEDARFARFLRELGSHLPEIVAIQYSDETREAFLKALDFCSEDIVVRAFELSAVLRDTLSGLMEHATATGERVQLPEDPLGFLTDPDVHSEVMEGLFGALTATACQLALVRLAQRNRVLRWFGWRGRGNAIATRWVRGLEAYLRLLASIPGASVPLHVVPSDERLDPARIAFEVKAREEFLSRVGDVPSRVASEETSEVAPDGD
jgi:hypothetical protein